LPFFSSSTGGEKSPQDTLCFNAVFISFHCRFTN
jgi:hypothetical protein